MDKEGRRLWDLTIWSLTVSRSKRTLAFMLSELGSYWRLEQRSDLILVTGSLLAAVLRINCQRQEQEQENKIRQL